MKLCLIKLLIARYLKSLNYLAVFRFVHQMSDLDVLSSCNALEYVSCYVHAREFGSEW